MRKFPIVLLLMFFLASSAHALQWAYPFVVWNGDVYEVKLEEMIEESEIGKRLGEVETKPHEMTGDHYGNASNYFPIGTNYYEIKGISTSTAIAVENNEQWVEAVYAHKAPFHIKNILSNVFLIITVAALLMIGMVYYVYRKNRSTRHV
ncbi:hypothetical protein [Sporosarcina sp. ITBMC105]